MEKIPQEQLLKRYYLLPISLQDALFSEQTAGIISKTCILREAEEHTPVIAKLAGRVLLGYLRPENFATEIQKETGIDGVKAAQVAHDIDTEIFSSVRLELKKLYPPTIQTPTVQAQGFVPRAPEPPAVAARYAPEPARPYVVPIPEKFRTRSAWPGQQTQESRPSVTETPESAPAIKEEQKPVLVADAAVAEKKEVIPQPATAPSMEPPPTKPLPATSYQPQTDIKPIVPLPTFIQSKFKETLKQTTGEKQTTQENPALKSAITQFTTPHTAAKPAEEQPQQSVYREVLPEEQKQTPHTGAEQKTEGKVIDLSGL